MIIVHWKHDKRLLKIEDSPLLVRREKTSPGGRKQPKKRDIVMGLNRI
jgi:hypothetical protein